MRLAIYPILFIALLFPTAWAQSDRAGLEEPSDAAYGKACVVANANAMVEDDCACAETPTGRACLRRFATAQESSSGNKSTELSQYVNGCEHQSIQGYLKFGSSRPVCEQHRKAIFSRCVAKNNGAWDYRGDHLWIGGDEFTSNSCCDHLTAADQEDLVVCGKSAKADMSISSTRVRYYACLASGGDNWVGYTDPDCCAHLPDAHAAQLRVCGHKPQNQLLDQVLDIAKDYCEQEFGSVEACAIAVAQTAL